MSLLSRDAALEQGLSLLTVELEADAEVLRRKSEPVQDFGPSLEQFCQRMFVLMKESNGIGLAAPQVGVLERIFVVQLAENEPAYTFVNPEIEPVGDWVEESEEGCLSVPGIYAALSRSQRIVVRARDAKGRPFESGAEDLLAVCIQHENDHLEGILFIDYLKRSQQKQIRKHFERGSEP